MLILSCPDNQLLILPKGKGKQSLSCKFPLDLTILLDHDKQIVEAGNNSKLITSMSNLLHLLECSAGRMNILARWRM
jgi:hypothetical protein